MKTTKPKNPRFEVYAGQFKPHYGGVNMLEPSEWRWRLYARNGEIVASGEGFSRKYDADRAVAAVKRAVLKIVEAK